MNLNKRLAALSDEQYNKLSLKLIPAVVLRFISYILLGIGTSFSIVSIISLVYEACSMHELKICFLHSILIVPLGIILLVFAKKLGQCILRTELAYEENKNKKYNIDLYK